MADDRSSAYPLEPTVDEMRALGDRALAFVLGHLSTLDTQPSVDLDDAERVAASVSEPLPSRGEPYDALLHRLFDELIPKSINTASPGAMSYVQGGGLFHAALADFIALSVNRYVAYKAASPALAEIESTVLRWFLDMVGFPPEGGGALTTGGSLGNLMATVAARAERLGDDFRRARLYASSELHHSVQKAALIAGLPRDAVRMAPTDASFRVDPAALARLVEEDRSRGLEPFMLVGTAGTTSSGAIDDLHALADIALAHRLWFHVDAAYGGFFLLTERGRHAMQGIERADSVVLDPHKSLFLPYGTGALLVRDVETLKRSHELHSHYVEAVRATHEDSYNPADVSPEMTRDFRGLRVWLPMKMLGADAFRDALDEKLDLARWATDELAAMSELEIVARPQLSTLAFRVRASSPEEGDTRTQALMDGVNGRGRVHLSSTLLEGRFAIRICVLSFRVHRENVAAALADIRLGLRGG